MIDKVVSLMPKEQRLCALLVLVMGSAFVAACVLLPAERIVGQAIVKYCEEVPPEQRMTWRRAVNEHSNGAYILIQCE